MDKESNEVLKLSVFIWFLNWAMHHCDLQKDTLHQTTYVNGAKHLHVVCMIYGTMFCVGVSHICKLQRNITVGACCI